MLDQVRDLLEYPGLRAGGILLASILVAWLAEVIITRVIGRLARKTQTSLDDEIADALRRPVFITVILIGAWWAVLTLGPSFRVSQIMRAVLMSVGIMVWSVTAFVISGKILRTLALRARDTGRRSIIHPRTIPVFDMLVKIALVAAAIYFALLAWKIDVTAWLASAGIVGIAVGFAAKDTLANLFAGIFIIADAPYKVGDFIVLDADLRGRVTSIGIRSTRILTLDDVEITVPNAIIGNSKIVNEVGGPSPRQRVAIKVSAAYGADIDRVVEVLLECTEGVELICEKPEPRVLFRAFGASGLDYELLVWLEDAARRDELVDVLNSRVYKRFAAAGLEIPYSKHDVYIKEMRGDPAGQAK